MAQKICKSAISVFLLVVFGDFIRLSNAFEECKKDFFKDVMVFDIGLNDEGNGGKVIFALLSRVKRVDKRRVSAARRERLLLWV